MKTKSIPIFNVKSDANNENSLAKQFYKQKLKEIQMMESRVDSPVTETTQYNNRNQQQAHLMSFMESEKAGPAVQSEVQSLRGRFESQDHIYNQQHQPLRVRSNKSSYQYQTPNSGSHVQSQVQSQDTSPVKKQIMNIQDVRNMKIQVDNLRHTLRRGVKNPSQGKQKPRQKVRSQSPSLSKSRSRSRSQKNFIQINKKKIRSISKVSQENKIQNSQNISLRRREPFGQGLMGPIQNLNVNFNPQIINNQQRPDLFNINPEILLLGSGQTQATGKISQPLIQDGSKHNFKIYQSYDVAPSHQRTVSNEFQTQSMPHSKQQSQKSMDSFNFLTPNTSTGYNSQQISVTQIPRQEKTRTGRNSPNALQRSVSGDKKEKIFQTNSTNLEEYNRRLRDPGQSDLPSSPQVLSPGSTNIEEYALIKALSSAQKVKEPVRLNKPNQKPKKKSPAVSKDQRDRSRSRKGAERRQAASNHSSIAKYQKTKSRLLKNSQSQSYKNISATFKPRPKQLHKTPSYHAKPYSGMSSTKKRSSIPVNINSNSVGQGTQDTKKYIIKTGQPHSPDQSSGGIQVFERAAKQISPVYQGSNHESLLRSNVSNPFVRSDERMQKPMVQEYLMSDYSDPRPSDIQPAIGRNKIISTQHTQTSNGVQIVHIYKDSLETEERERYTTIQSNLMKNNQSTSSNRGTKVVYTDSLEPKESTQKLFPTQMRKNGAGEINTSSNNQGVFYVLKTDPESVYLKTEQEAAANHDPFTFQNTIHSDRKDEKHHQNSQQPLNKKMDRNLLQKQGKIQKQ